MEPVIIICVIVVVLFAAIMAILSRYRKCPSDKVLVIYGKVGTDKNGQARSARCIHGGAAFIVPIIQSYEYMDLTPISINVDLKNALSKQNIRIDVPSRFTVGISTEPGVMQNAAERLLGLKLIEIQELAKDIIFGQLRLIIATMDIEEINSDRDKFLLAVSNNVEIELKKIGLKLINVNVTDITDESGYLEALGKEAAAKAINDAKKSVAEKHRDGEIGQANAQKDQRIQVAAANASAIDGENQAKIEVAQSEALRREREAEALRQATAAEAVQAAKARNTDVLICDTAGRLQNKVNLMNELEKMNRIIKRVVPEGPHETLLVVDATTGQNGVSQAIEFSKITDITGIVLTKMDGTAKGGIVLSIKDQLNIPVKFIGLGEQVDDLQEFDLEQYIYGLCKGLVEEA